MYMEFGAQKVMARGNIVKGDDDHDHNHNHNHNPAATLLDQYYRDLINLPPGFRFHPTDEEIITHYLTPKVINPRFTASAIGQVDLNKIEPWDLPQKEKMGEKEWFFFCQRDRKYPTGMRTNRATESGYWKATGKDKEIHNKNRGSNSLVGMKKTLVFYKGRAPKGDKTNWVMHEFRLDGKFSYFNFPKASKDEWVVCRVIHKNSTTGINNKRPISSTNDHQELTRMNSFVNSLLDNPSSLPPLLPSDFDDKLAVESSFTKNKDNCPIPIEEIEIKGKIVNSTLSYSTTGLNTQYNTFHMPPYTYNFSSNTYTYRGGPVIRNQISSNFQIGPSSGGDRTPAEEFTGSFKVDHYLLPLTNQSISHSQDTGFSTAHDTNTEISSSSMAIPKHEDVINPLLRVPSFSDFDSFWEY